MKRLFFTIIICGLISNAFAQPIPFQSVKDSIIGWIKIYNFKGAKTGIKVDSKVYSVNQLSICDSLANWMQASYMPKGALGDIRKVVSEKLSPYNQHTAGTPQSYGAAAKIYMELKYNDSRKIVPFTNSHVWWSISANAIPGDWGIRDICTPDQYYFTMPLAETEITEVNKRKQVDLSNEKNIRPYITFWVKSMGFGGGIENVLLCKDNQSPFINITKGEYLQALETAIPLFYEVQKKKIYEAEQGNQQRMVFPLKELDTKINRFKSGIKQNREKYKDRLGEPATTSAQPGFADLDNGRDVFTSQYLTDPETTATRYPVYKVDPVMAGLCKTDKPQWILVSWEYYSGNTIEDQQHKAIISNFNFDYVYNFFFAPEKVKGKPYKPLRSPFLQHKLY